MDAFRKNWGHFNSPLSLSVTGNGPTLGSGLSDHAGGQAKVVTKHCRKGITGVDNLESLLSGNFLEGKTEQPAL
jgi:hypothetical protein